MNKYQTCPIRDRLKSLHDAFYQAINNELGFGIQTRLVISNDIIAIQITHRELNNLYSQVTLNDLISRAIDERTTTNGPHIQTTKKLIQDLQKQIDRLEVLKGKLLAK